MAVDGTAFVSPIIKETATLWEQVDYYNRGEVPSANDHIERYNRMAYIIYSLHNPPCCAIPLFTIGKTDSTFVQFFTVIYVYLFRARVTLYVRARICLVFTLLCCCAVVLLQIVVNCVVLL